VLSGPSELARRLDEGSSNAAAGYEESDLEHDRDCRIAVLCVGQAPFRTGTDGAIWFLRDGFVRQGMGASALGVQQGRKPRFVAKGTDADD
jgi:hypothetical protein